MIKGLFCYGIISIFYFIFLVSCKSYKQKIFIKEYYASGKLKSKGWCTAKDSIPIDSIFFYYENGNLESIQVKDDSGLTNGISRYYFENGKIEGIDNYVHGMAQGFSNNYTEDGKRYDSIFFLNNNQVGDFYGFSKNGDINYYAFLDFKGQNRNLMKWDSTGKLVKDLRHIIVVVDSGKIVAAAGRKNEFLCDIKFLISNPPKCRSSLNIAFFSNEGRVMKKDSVTGVPFYQIKTYISDVLDSIKILAIQFDSVKNKNSYETINIY